MAIKTDRVKPNQSVKDIVLMNYGTVEARMDFCRHNDISPSAVLAVGKIYEVPTVDENGVAIPTDKVVLQYIADSRGVMGTLNVDPPPPGPPLEYSIILYPKMIVTPNVVGAPHVIGYYSYDIHAADDFKNVYDLVDSYLTNNPVIYQTEEKYVIEDPSFNATQESVTAMTAKSVPYHLEWTVGLGYMMVWSDLEAPNTTITYKDVQGNSAFVAPLVILNNINQELVLYLLARIQFELVEATDTQLKLRIERKHETPFVEDFANLEMEWTHEALTGEPDPDDPENPNKRILTLGAGVYTLGVATTYTHAFGYVFPRSAFTMVIEVA